MTSIFTKLNLKAQPEIAVFPCRRPSNPNKGTSKRYACEFNRDTGWQVIRGLGFDSVRQVAIDEDWTTLRFRRKEYIQAR